jgi:Ca-activated chloride channel family protein
MNKSRTLSILAIGIVGILAVGTWRDANFWLKPDRRGDWLMMKGKYQEAAKAYADPWHVGMAQFRNSDFEAAAHTFARVPGAAGAYDQGNAWLMHGQYDSAVASYDRALGFKPGWKEAEENKALALARKALIDGAGKDRDQESAEAYKPDDIKFDQKGEDKKGEPQEMAGGDMSDKELQASWLRRVTTTPGDFLKAKFAYQAAKGGAK